MNTFTSSDNKKKSQGNTFHMIQKTIFKNSSGIGKKVFICISTIFYKYSLHTTDLQFQLQFTVYFYLFVETKP